MKQKEVKHESQRLLDAAQELLQIGGQQWALLKKIGSILRKRFEDIEIRFDHEKGERISGFLISKKFSRMSHFTRQGVIWKLLRENLSDTQQRKILGFLIYTPREIQAYSEAYEGVG
jgi:hypothetical protein